jgi:hypothetical protein
MNFPVKSSAFSLNTRAIYRPLGKLDMSIVFSLVLNIKLPLKSKISMVLNEVFRLSSMVLRAGFGNKNPSTFTLAMPFPPVVVFNLIFEAPKQFWVLLIISKANPPEGNVFVVEEVMSPVIKDTPTI